MFRALLVDKNYIALNIISWKKAAKLLVKGKAEPLDFYNNRSSVKTSNGIFTIPSIIRLVEIIPWRAHKSRLRFSKRNVMLRDKSCCQYCGVKVGKASGTIDHIIPRSKGGKSTYANCVVCCKSCNNIKGSKTPESLGMRLLTRPRTPSFTALYRDYLNDNSPAEWGDFIIGAPK